MGFLARGLVATFALTSFGCRPRLPVGPARSTPAASAGVVQCGQPARLHMGGSLRASTATGQDKLRASCVRGSAPECVFELEVEQSSELRVALETAEFDGSLALYEQLNGGQSLRELRCVDDTPAGDLHHSRLESSIAPGRYLVVVDGANRQSGEFELFAELEPLATVSDRCADARPLTPGVALRDSTRGGSNLFSATCGGGAQGPEHVHTIELRQPGRIRVRQQAEYDGSLYLRARCEDASTELTCNDDFLSNARSLIAARLPAGTYYVFSDSYSREQSGEYTVSVEVAAEPEPLSADALCADAARATGKGATRDLDTLHGSFAFAGSCGGKDTPEQLVSFRVDAPTTLTAKLEDAEFNAVMYVRKTCGEPNSELACFIAPRVDRPPSELELASPALVVPLERGVYTLVLDGYDVGDMGAATLLLSFNP